MFGASIYAARIYNAALYTASGGAPPTPPATGRRGRLLVRWLLEIPPVKNPMGEYVWRRENDEELFIL